MSENQADSPERHAGPARRRWWLWLPGGCLGFMALIFLLGWAVVSRRANSRWKDFAPRHAQLQARVLGRPEQREPLEGPAVEGNAFVKYLSASETLAKMTSKEKSAIDDARDGKGGPETLALAYAALDAHAADLAALREASHLSSYRDTLDWEAGWSATLGWLAPFRSSCRVLELSAKRRREAGDLDGAIDDVAAIAQIGVDAASGGPAICALVGIATLRFSTNQAGLLATDPALTVAQAARLARLFERADAALRPIEEILESEHLLINETLAALAEGRSKMDDLGFPAASRALAWQHGFSWRVVAADVDEACARVSAEGREMSGRDWRVAAEAYQRTAVVWQKDTFLSLLYTPGANLDRACRSIRARFRLLRALCHERTAGAPLAPVPDDPFTLKPLHRREAGLSSVWWSEFTDGDQGGTGTFEVDPESSGDIPLEWKTSR
jgi:hypothetical protein